MIAYHENDNKYCCEICKKEYTRKSSLEKHKILCDFKIKTIRERNIIVEEAGDIPNHYELVKIVQELMLRNIKLEEKVDQMQKWVQTKKKKLNIISWLNANVNVIMGFKEWVHTVVDVKDEHLAYLMDNTLFHTVQNIFEYNLPDENDECIVYPIKCFNEKQGMFYVADKCEDGTTIWRNMEHSDMAELLKVIHNKMIKNLTSWRKANQSIINDNSNISDKYNKAIIKWMNMSFSHDGTYSRMKTGLYNYLKQDLKKMIEYEIEF